MGSATEQPDFSRLLEGLFQRTGDGVLLSRTDGTIFRANPAACALLGRTEAEIVRLGRQGLVVDEPEYRERVAEREAHGFTAGVIRFRRPDGSTFPAEFTSAVIPGDAGPPAACVIFRDVSGRREADELRALEDAVALLPLGVVVLEVPPGGAPRVIASNERYWRIVGASPAPGTPADQLPRQVFEPGRERTSPVSELPAVRAIRDGAPTPAAEYHVRRADGSWRVVTAVAAPVAGRRPGASPRAVTVALDVTEAWTAAEAVRTSEARLRASERALRLLVGTNEALLRARDETGLFREVCRVAVEQGGFHMAWAGLAGPGPERAIQPVAWHGHEDGYLAGARLTWSEEVRGQGPAGIAMRTGRVAVVNDLASDPSFAPWREAALARGYGSNAALPLVHGGAQLGIIGVFAAERDAFTPEIIDVLQRMAEDLAFGLTVLRERAAAERASTELSLATRLLGLEVLRVDLGTGLVSLSPRARAQRGLPPGEGELALEELAARMEPADRAALVEGLALARAGGPLPAATQPAARRYRLPDGTARWLEACATLLRDAAGRPESILSASIDVTDRVEEQERLRALTARVQRVREEEMARIARDLHDDLGQVLTALRLELRGAEALVEGLGTSDQAGAVLDRLVAASALAGETIAAVQRLSWGLRPEALDRLGLGAAVRQELRNFRRRTGLEVADDVQELPPVAPAVATAAFRIAQEALTNVARHAGAARVEVRLAAEGEGLVLEVADDGRGFAPGVHGTTHLGLLGMQERAREFGGEVALGPRPGGGTVVRARLPRRPPGEEAGPAEAAEAGDRPAGGSAPGRDPPARRA